MSNNTDKQSYRYYQQEFIDAARGLLLSNDKYSSGIIQAATGTGKSVIIKGIVEEALKLDYTIISLVYSINLNEQNNKYLSETIDKPLLGLRGKEYRKVLQDNDDKIFYSTASTLYNKLAGGKLSTERLTFINNVSLNNGGKILLIVDEAHYQSDIDNNRIKLIRDYFINKGHKVVLIGLTATPYSNINIKWYSEVVDYLNRDPKNNTKIKDIISKINPMINPEIRGLISLIDGELYQGFIGKPYSIYKAVNDGYLNQYKVERGYIPCHLNNDDLRSLCLEEMDKLNVTQSKSVYNKIKYIVNVIKYESDTSDERFIVYLSSIMDCRVCSNILNRLNIPTNYVSADDTSNLSRADALNRFKAGKIKVLLNYEVLTTGYDDPALSKAIILRNISSILTTIQIVGRVLRKIEGKSISIIRDYLPSMGNRDTFYETFYIDVKSIEHHPGKILKYNPKIIKEALKEINIVDKCKCGTEYTIIDNDFDCVCDRHIKWEIDTDYSKYPYHHLVDYCDKYNIDLPLSKYNERLTMDLSNYIEYLKNIKYVDKTTINTYIPKGYVEFAKFIKSDLDKSTLKGVTGYRYDNVSSPDDLTLDNYFIKRFLEDILKRDCDYKYKLVNGNEDFIPKFKCPVCNEYHVSNSNKCTTLNIELIPPILIKPTGENEENWYKVLTIYPEREYNSYTEKWNLRAKYDVQCPFGFKRQYYHITPWGNINRKDILDNLFNILGNNAANRYPNNLYRLSTDERFYNELISKLQELIAEGCLYIKPIYVKYLNGLPYGKDYKNKSHVLFSKGGYK